MKRKIFRLPLILAALVLVACLLFPAGSTVYADVIVEPWEDQFYQEHKQDCEEVDETYYANGPSGETHIYGDPESFYVAGSVTNGEILDIEMIYTDADGVQWGYTQASGSQDGHYVKMIGWVPMSYLVKNSADVNRSKEEITSQDEKVTKEETTSPDPQIVIQKNKNKEMKNLILTGVGIVVLIAATAVIIYVIYRQKKKK